MNLPSELGGYGPRELRYAAPFANALVDDIDFRAWVLSRTKFAKYAPGARVLDRECSLGEVLTPPPGGDLIIVKNADATVAAAEKPICWLYLKTPPVFVSHFMWK